MVPFPTVDTTALLVAADWCGEGEGSECVVPTTDIHLAQ